MASRRSSLTVRLAPGLCGIEALGAGGAEVLLGRADSAETLDAPGGTGARARVVRQERGRVELRFPLPGTPDASGRLSGRPGGSGTGWVRLIRFDARGLTRARELWGARLGAPPSRSLAAREWNLFCYLNAHGVATPELLALGELGRGPVAARSFLVVRELEGWQRLDRWLERAGPGRPAARDLARAADALGRTLGALRRAGVWLPALELSDLWIAPARAGGCGPPATSPSAAPGLRLRPASALALARLRRGRLAAGTPDSSWAALLNRLGDEARAKGPLPDSLARRAAVRAGLARAF